jgi:hypothetical protein
MWQLAVWGDSAKKRKENDGPMDTILFVSVPYTTLLNPVVQQKSTTC